MDYEQLYTQLQVLEKDFKDKFTILQRTLKNLYKNSEKGEIRSIFKDLTQMETALKDAGETVSQYTAAIEHFDAKEYMESGDFARQMTAYCESFAVDVQGEYPVYDIFPYKVRIDSENQDVYIDRKKHSCVRPLSIVKTIKQNQERLHKAAFNANAFLNELAAAYDAVLRGKEKGGGAVKSGRDIFLRDIYLYLVPMQRFRKEYDMQSYALDLARLFDSGAELTKDGRKIEFGSSRQPAKLIRILDKNGNERLLGTVRFFEPEE